MYNSSSGSTYEVRLGATRLDTTDPGSQTFRSTVAIIHNEYNAATLENDIAAIELPSAVSYNGENCYILINMKLIFFICFVYSRELYLFLI
jgi:hypothetical protein